MNLNAQRSAVVLLANDRILALFVLFMEAFRTWNPDRRVIVIPFDDDMNQVRALTAVYGFEIYAEDIQRVDAFADDLFGSAIYLRHRLRKLSAFQMDLDEFLYIDVDILALQPVDMFFGHLQPNEIDLLYATGGRATFSQTAGAEKLSGQSFATGLFASSPATVPLNEVLSVIRSHRELYLRIRAKHLFDQPLLNLALDKLNKQAVCANRLGIDVSYAGAFSLPDLKVHPGGVVTKGSEVVTLLHLAGPSKFKPERLEPFRLLLQRYWPSAQERCRSALGRYLTAPWENDIH